MRDCSGSTIQQHLALALLLIDLTTFPAPFLSVLSGFSQNIAFGLDVETLEDVGAPGSLFKLKVSQSRYTQVRPGMTRESIQDSRKSDGTLGFVSDVNTLDNAPAIINVAWSRFSASKEFMRQRRLAIDSLKQAHAASKAARARMLQATSLKQEQAKKDSMRMPLMLGTATDADEESGGSLLLSSTAAGSEEELSPEDALSRLAPLSKYNDGISRADRNPLAASVKKKAEGDTAKGQAAANGGNGSTGSGASSQDQGKLLRQVKRERAIREWIRQQSLKEEEKKKGSPQQKTASGDEEEMMSDAEVISVWFGKSKRQSGGAAESFSGGVHGLSSASIAPAAVAIEASAKGATAKASSNTESLLDGAASEAGDPLDIFDQDDDDIDDNLPGCTGLLPPPTPTLPFMRHIIKCAKLANAYEFICNLPDGFETVLGNGLSGSLSGGQRQRTMIAASIARPCSVLILDEATASLE